MPCKLAVVAGEERNVAELTTRYLRPCLTKVESLSRRPGEPEFVLKILGHTATEVGPGFAVARNAGTGHVIGGFECQFEGVRGGVDVDPVFADALPEARVVGPSNLVMGLNGIAPLNSSRAMAMKRV